MTKRNLLSVILLSALLTLAVSIADAMRPNLHAGSMKWFEIETTSYCKSSPANRLVRPPVCLGFELSNRLLASR